MRVLALAIAIATAGCAAGPLTPTQYTCATKPRVYISPSGSRQLEVDHYAQVDPCPAEPIE
jgi:hypothetical protein